MKSQEELVATGLSGLAAFDAMKNWNPGASFPFGKRTGEGKLRAIHFGISLHKMLLKYV
jgi:hypothetical protein